ncbi:glucan 1,6-alpha-glucosidase [Enterococcus villorum ATCC 700913]|nr:glucan 1,6-alpha-glucosidase [Enterococcus villorum ATCC 700913]EOW75469.1 glucan 1,6-alpha-glucosidase [Enterococcus villorum ATCC 700913]
MMNFWIEKGIGGFRMDVIDTIGKLPDQEITSNGPKLHEYLQEMNQATFGTKDLMTVGETWGATTEIAKLYSDPKRNELSMIFQFEHIGLDQQSGKDKWDLKPLSIPELKQVLSKWQTSLGDDGWNSLFWNNHDLPRIISRWGNDQTYREESGKMFAILLHMMKGTPYIYQGEEIGMTNYPISEIAQAQDIETINMYYERLSLGYAKEDILRSINAKGRDNARTPMQWDRSPNAGFTKGIPWLHVNPNYKEINVQSALADKHSIFYTYKKLIELRKQHEIIVWGEYQLITETPDDVFAYYRLYKEEKWLIVCNISEKTNQMTLPSGDFSLVMSNYPQEETSKGKITLRPYEAFVLKRMEQ